MMPIAVQKNVEIFFLFLIINVIHDRDLWDFAISRNADFRFCKFAKEFITTEGL